MSIYNSNVKQTLGVGTIPNDGTGDPLRTIFIKTNNNFSDLYTFLGNGTHLGNINQANFGNITVGNISLTGVLTSTGDFSSSGISTLGNLILTGNLISGTIGPSVNFSSSGVSAGNYGNATHYVGLVIDNSGRITSANTILAGLGPQGFQGAQGDIGVQGFQGIQGSQGIQGIIGPQGNLGGDTGAQGFQGNQGVQGAQGFQGHQGVQGAQGVQGIFPGRIYSVTNSGYGAYVIDGSNNPTLNLLRGFTYQFNVNASGHPFWIQTVSGAYSSGNVYNTGVTNNGTDNGIITFAIPYNAPSTLYYVCQYHSSMQGTINISDYGPNGFQGAQGVQGAEGIQGAIGPPSSVGAQGAQGFTGTQGAQGVQGPQGFQGYQGVQGDIGVQGPQGFTGTQGAQGVQGPQGFQGYQGVQGDIGVQGPQGFIGAQGAQGPQGFTGAQGPQGFTGAQGPAGAQGPTGPTGPQGLSSSPSLTITASLGVGTPASGTQGEIRATNNITAYYSDDRLKNKIANIDNAVNRIKALSGFYFRANDLAKTYGYQSELQVGVSAQEVQKVLPEVVVPAPIDDKYLTVRYEKIIPLLIEGIKELEEKILNLDNKYSVHDTIIEKILNKIN